ncbi:MAG TPA: FAD-dependent oxidoreductase, partial [Anaeromyxobacteraceae bacterium]|nr:FAD-dependent oxidoreductase [Anaeromyxobacteraceae bacterium]
MIVLGAGAAGLAAGALLARRGLPVTVVEARDRPGGRVDTYRDRALGLALERGAEFVHGRPARTLALARRARAPLRAIPYRHQLRRGDRLLDGGAAFAEAERTLALGRRDGEPFDQVLRRAPSAARRADVAALARGFVRGFYLADPRTASARALARMTEGMEEIEGDALSRVEGGYARVLEPLLADLRRGGAEVRLSTAAEVVRWRRGGVRVEARGPTGARLAPLSGRGLVVTVPPSLVARDAPRFAPALPEKRAAARALPMGPIVKVVLRFRRPPWNGRRRRGLVFLHLPGAAVPVFWTTSPLPSPVLVGWAGGPDGARLGARGRKGALAAAVAAAARGLGRTPRALEDLLDGAEVVDWSRDPLARGGYATFP